MNNILLPGMLALAPFLLVSGCASNNPNHNQAAGQTENTVLAKTNNTSSAHNKPSPKSENDKPADMIIAEENKFPLTEIAATKPVKKPETMVFQFGFDKQQLDNEAKAILMQHAEYLSANSNLILKVKGHTDTRGPKAYNEMLSKERANSVATMLIEYGAIPGQLQVIGKGDSEPLNDVNNFAENRRVELQYLDLQTADTDSETQQRLSRH